MAIFVYNTDEVLPYQFSKVIRDLVLIQNSTRERDTGSIPHPVLNMPLELRAFPPVKIQNSKTGHSRALKNFN